MVKKTVPEPTRILIDFIKTAQLDQDYTFTAPKGAGDKWLHRMRVELSRMRAKVRSMKRVPKHFKVLHVETRPDPENPAKELVTIRKSESRNDASNIIDEIFSELAGGPMVEA